MNVGSAVPTLSVPPNYLNTAITDRCASLQSLQLTASAFQPSSRRRACTNCVLSVTGGLHRNPGPTGVSTVQRGSTKRGIGGNLVSAPVCSHEYPYVGFLSVPDYSLSYVYVFAFFVVGAIFVTALLTLSRLVAPRKATKEKLRTYESGEEPIGQAWGRYPTHFYVFALLFVVFDVEVIFLFPWAVLFRSLGVTGLIEMIVFIGILVVGLYYAWKKDALNWY